ncbi:MAG: TolC family protein [Verrucomicrobiota bacterium]|nr:TolC family protein [Verrucomicrobiota bacterium]
MKFTFYNLRFAICGALTLAAGISIAPAQPTNADTLPIDLPTALRLAGAQSLDVRIARDQLKEAQANRASALENFFPWLAPGVAYHRRDGVAQAVPAGTISDARFQSYAPGATVTAQVDLGDAIYTSLAARQLAAAASHSFDAQRQDAVLAAAQGYFDLAKAKALVGAAGETLRIAQNYQNQLQEAVAAGIAFKGDELRAQTETEHDQLLLRRAAEQQRVAAARLAQILHLDATVELVPKESDLAPLALVETNAALDTLARQALRNRPELQQGRALTLAARDAKNGATYGPLVPTIGAQYFGGALGGGPDSGSDNLGPESDLFAGVSWRIGPGGLFDFGKIHSSRARLDAARAEEEKIHDQILREVVEARTRADSLLDQLATAQTNLATADETLRLTQQRKEFGVGVVLENIQAQQELARARADYLNIVAEYDKAEYGLSRAIGGTLNPNENQTETIPSK